MSEQSSSPPILNETISDTNTTDSSMTHKISELVDYVLSKSLLLFGLIAVICIIILGIFIMIYCIIKKRKQSETHSDPGFGLSMKDKGTPGSRHFEFKKLQNTSSFGGDAASNNKENMSLSEIRIKNLKMENNLSNAVTNESVSERGRKKKKAKKENVENVDGEEKKVSQKKLEKEIKKQIGKYVNQDE